MVDHRALIKTLVDGCQTLHAEDVRLASVLRQIQRTREVGPAEFEALIDAQQAALRVPAGALLMFAQYIGEDVERRGDSKKTESRLSRARRAWAVLRGLDLT